MALLHMKISDLLLDPHLDFLRFPNDLGIGVMGVKYFSILEKFNFDSSTGEFANGLHQANLCLRAFRHDKF